MKVIINADDYGLTRGVSEGILLGMRNGVITDTSAIVNADAFEECARLARTQGIKAMGLHCLLTMGKPLSDPQTIPSLVNEQGMFMSREQFMAADISLTEAEAELELQIAKLQRSGLQLSHIDTHHGFMGKSKAMSELFIKLAKKYHVPLRNEFVRGDKLVSVKPIDLSQAGVRCTDALYINHGYPHHTTVEVIESLQKAMRQYETIEICCHAGFSDDELRALSVLNEDRKLELDVMLDPQLRAFIQTNDLHLMSYADYNKEGAY